MIKLRLDSPRTDTLIQGGTFKSEMDLSEAQTRVQLIDKRLALAKSLIQRAFRGDLGVSSGCQP